MKYIFQAIVLGFIVVTVGFWTRIDLAIAQTPTLTPVPVNQPPTAEDYNLTGYNRTDLPWQAYIVTLDMKYHFSDDNVSEPLTYHAVGTPVNGSIVGEGEGAAYLPNPGFTGTETLSWYVNDGEYDSNTATVTITISGPPPSGTTYYMSPTGNDASDGLTESNPWGTFDHVWTVIQPGDTLILADGVYYQAIHPHRIGKVGNPVTIRAQNDGKAIIDGSGMRIPVDIEGWRQSFFIIEGIMARNGSEGVFRITGDHNVLRRVSGYSADTDENAHVFIIVGDYNLLEDCAASGTGRKMIVVFKGDNNTIRRCHADWRQWDGRSWHDCWPNGKGIEFYNASFNIIENSISYGQVPGAGISVLSQGTPSNGNKILGSMAIQSGMKPDGTPMVWGDTRPQPSEYTCVSKIFEWPTYLLGFTVNVSGGTVKDNLFQDILAWGNGRYGINFHSITPTEISNNHVNRATIFNNGLNNPMVNLWGGYGAGARESSLALFNSIENSYIENIWTNPGFVTQQGEGARLTNRYVDGVLTGEPLWPWPMEERIKDEMGYSVTCTMGTIINDAYAGGYTAEGIDMTTRDPNWASDPDNLVIQACNDLPIDTPTPIPSQPGDTDSDGDVDMFDYNNLLAQFGQSGSGLSTDFDSDNDVDIFDYNTLLTNFGM